MMMQPRILLVDDGRTMGRTLGPLLRSRGYEVEIAGTAAETPDKIALRRPDLVVLNVELPDVQVVAVCRRIRATSEIPIIILSAPAAEADKVKRLHVLYPNLHKA